MTRYRADNKTLNGKVPVIEATRSDIEFEAKRFFNWRGSTKKYNSVFDRVMAQGSSKFDDFVIYMVEQGYAVENVKQRK